MLREIDDICGDTWCEGEFDFDFQKANCNPTQKSCTVDFIMSKADFIKVEKARGTIDYAAVLKSASTKSEYIVSCLLPGMGSFAAKLDKSTDDHAYFAPLSKCINHLEILIRLK